MGRHKGCIPWNKGKKGVQVPWNKGLKGVHSGNRNPMYGKNHSEESKLKISKTRIEKGIGKKENNPKWKGGITPLRKIIRECSKMYEWKSSILERDSFTCQECRKHGGDLEAHHIKEFYKILRENNIESLEEALLCEELWNLENGKTLCKKCHEITKKKVFI